MIIGRPTSDRYGFLSTTYGQTDDDHGRYHDFVSIFLGDRPEPLGSFEPDFSKTAALDWSPFTTVIDPSSPNLTLAKAHGTYSRNVYVIPIHQFAPDSGSIYDIFC